MSSHSPITLGEGRRMMCFPLLSFTIHHPQSTVRVWFLFHHCCWYDTFPGPQPKTEIFGVCLLYSDNTQRVETSIDSEMLTVNAPNIAKSIGLC